MEALGQAIDEAIRKGAAHFICGNAVGVDNWAAVMTDVGGRLNVVF